MTLYDELRDINPKFWLSAYNKTSVVHLTTMGVFYLVIGLGLQYVGNSLAEHLISNYQVPSVPISLTAGLSSGPLEETIFFGTPFYLNGNYLIVLAGGIIWSLLHIFNTNNFVMTNLAYGSVFFTIPHVFFSLRTWISGKGWFAVLFHTSWNGIVLVLQCTQGLNCIAFGSGIYFILDMTSIFAAVAMIIVLYRIHQYRKNMPQNRKL